MAASLRAFVDLAQEIVSQESRKGVLMDIGPMVPVQSGTSRSLRT